MSLASSRKKPVKKSTIKKPSTIQPSTRAARRFAEAPDRGQVPIESPEVERTPNQEAPDWGDSVLHDHSSFHTYS